MNAITRIDPAVRGKIGEGEFPTPPVLDVGDCSVSMGHLHYGTREGVAIEEDVDGEVHRGPFHDGILFREELHAEEIDGLRGNDEHGDGDLLIGGLVSFLPRRDVDDDVGICDRIRGGVDERVVPPTPPLCQYVKTQPSILCISASPLHPHPSPAPC